MRFAALSSGEFASASSLQMSDAKSVQYLRNTLHPLILSEMCQSVQDVLLNRHVREKGKILKHVAHPPLGHDYVNTFSESNNTRLPSEISPALVLAET